MCRHHTPPTPQRKRQTHHFSRRHCVSSLFAYALFIGRHRRECSPSLFIPTRKRIHARTLALIPPLHLHLRHCRPRTSTAVVPLFSTTHPQATVSCRVAPLRSSTVTVTGTKIASMSQSATLRPRSSCCCGICLRPRHKLFLQLHSTCLRDTLHKFRVSRRSIPL